MTQSTTDKSNQITLISVVIVNFRSWGKLTACLDSLSNLDKPNFKLEVIVVDNCSNDGNLDKFVKQYPTFHFILNIGNFGFAHGCNTGANIASGEFILFLNPDTEVLNDVFTSLVNQLSGLPEYSIVATQKANAKGKTERVERFFPRCYTLTGIGKAVHRLCIRKRLEQEFAKNKDVVFPEWVSGSVIFMRSKDYRALNGWDEKFWMYSEDVDLCKRATILGGKVALLQSVAIVHNHGGSSRVNPSTSALTKSEVYISRHIYIAQHFNRRTVYLVQGLLVIKSIVKTGLFALLSLILINHSKAKVSRNLFKNLLGYYTHALVHNTWLSPRSILFKK